MLLALFGITNERPQPVREPRGPLPGRRLDRADRLDVPGRQAPDPGPGAGRLRDRAPRCSPTWARSSTRSCARRSSSRTRASASSRSAPPSCALRQLEEQSCPNCGFPIERTYLRCPSCRARVKDPCESCEKPIDPRWTLCPVLRDATAPRRPPSRAGRPRSRAATPDAERARHGGPPGRKRAPREGRQAPARAEGARSAAVARTRPSRQASAGRRRRPPGAKAAQGRLRPRAPRPPRRPTQKNPGEDGPRPGHRVLTRRTRLRIGSLPPSWPRHPEP